MVQLLDFSIIRYHTMDHSMLEEEFLELITVEEGKVWCWRRTTPPKKYQIVAPNTQTMHLYTFDDAFLM